MKQMKNLFYLFLSLFVVTGCEKGLVYDEVPESVYENVSLATDFSNIRARELFKQKVWQVNYNQWTDIIITTTANKNIEAPYHAGGEYTNNSDADVIIMGETVKPGETTTVKNIITSVDDANAPEGKRYILNIFGKTKAIYKTPNKGHLFVQEAFEGDPVQPEFVDPVDGCSQEIILPVRQNDMIVELVLSDAPSCKVEPVDGAPQLGTPGDYTKSQMYMVTNITRRPDGKPARQRLYEVKVQLLP